MKKFLNIFTFLFVLVLSLSVFGCGEKSKNSDEGEKIEMSESYSKARNEFNKVTGILLPKLEKLEVSEYPYNEGDKSYCLDIISGENLNFQQYESFLKFFDEKLSSWEKTGPTTEGEYTNVNYNSANGDWIGVTWDATNNAIYINTMMK